MKRGGDLKRTELKRGKPLERGLGPKPKKAMKRSQPRRDWSHARAKVVEERVCRLWRDKACAGKVEAAHVLGREYDLKFENLVEAGDQPIYLVRPARILPLCQEHHYRYDHGEIDVLGALTMEEQLRAVKDAGGVELMRRRTAPLAYKVATSTP